MTMISCFDMGGVGGDFGDGRGAGACDRHGDGHGDEHGDPRHGTRRARASEGGQCTAGPVRVECAEGVGRFEFGAPSVVRAGGPRPDDHPAGRPDSEIRELLERKSRIREQGIQQVIEAEKARGSEVERFVAAIRYDSELAPRTTNRRQLLELGIEVPAADALPTDPDEIRHVLWTIIFGLARLGIFLTGTDSYSDSDLLERLCTRVLIDEVSDIPPSADMSEFVDLTPPASSAGGAAVDAEVVTEVLSELLSDGAPDGLMGPFEFEPQDDVDEVGRRQTRDPAHAPDEVPVVIDRDAFLPRPDRR